MNHPSDDTLLLLAYGELDEDARETTHAHLMGCADCRARLDTLERGRVAVDWALPRRRPRRLVALVALAAAALLAVVLLRPEQPQPGPLSLAVPRYTNPALAPIDSVLTRLEQEKPYAIP
jgi:hypothetical protein